jgi:hypothetical protein
MIWTAITRQGITSPQLPEPRCGSNDHAEPEAADIPAVDAGVGSGELIAAHLPQVLVMHDGSQVARAPASRRAAISTSAGARTLTTTAWARAAPDDHPGGETVRCSEVAQLEA